MSRAITCLLMLLTLAACVTTPEEPPLEMTQGNGAVAMDVTVTAVGIDNYFYLQISAIDPVNEKLATGPSAKTEIAGFRYTAEPFKPDHQLLVRELPPGNYVIEGLAIDPNRGQKHFLIGLMSEIAIATDNKGTYEQPRFVDETGSIKVGAPRFKVRPGIVTYIGELIFAANTKRLEVPQKDSSGYWDGQSTELRWDAEIIATYTTDAGDLSRHSRRLNLQTYKTETTLFPKLVGKQIVLKNYEMADEHRYMTNEYNFEISMVR